MIRKHEKQGSKAKSLMPVFKIFDLDKTGRVSFADYKRAITKAEIKPPLVSDAKLKKLFDALDPEGIGEMEYGILATAVEHKKPFKEIRRFGSVNISAMMADRKSVV